MDFMPFPKRTNSEIFIVADDLGLTKPVNDGIIFAFREGLIDAASLIANSRCFEDAVAQLNTVPSAKVGIHLVLVEEKSLLAREEIPSLADKDGRLPKDHKAFFLKYILGLIKIRDIEREGRAQIERVVNSGIRPAFLNSHQHLHLLPAIMDVTIKLAKEFNIPQIRVVQKPCRLKAGKFFRTAELMFLRVLSRLAVQKIKENGLITNDYLVGFINAGNLSIQDIEYGLNLKRENPEKLVELCCHPGFEDEDLRIRYKHWRYHWAKEMEVLKKAHCL